MGLSESSLRMVDDRIIKSIRKEFNDYEMFGDKWTNDEYRLLVSRYSDFELSSTVLLIGEDRNGWQPIFCKIVDEEINSREFEKAFLKEKI